MVMHDFGFTYISIGRPAVYLPATLMSHYAPAFSCN